MLAPALDTIRLTLHVLAATVWVGGQIVMTGLVGPARGLGADAPRTLARAFARLAWPAYVVLLVTGVWNVSAVHYAQQDPAWKAVLIAKIAVVVVAGTFIGTLIVVSVITVRISDMILDSRIGALDRTLGFMFGLARGLLIVVVAFMFFTWLVPDKQRPDWVTGAKSRVVLQGTGDWLMSLLPDDPENTILKKFKKNKPDDDSAADPDQATVPALGDGYSKPARDSLKKLIEKPAGQ